MRGFHAPMFLDFYYFYNYWDLDFINSDILNTVIFKYRLHEISSKRINYEDITPQ